MSLDRHPIRRGGQNRVSFSLNDEEIDYLDSMERKATESKSSKVKNVLEGTRKDDLSKDRIKGEIVLEQTVKSQKLGGNVKQAEYNEDSEDTSSSEEFPPDKKHKKKWTIRIPWKRKAKAPVEKYEISESSDSLEDNPMKVDAKISSDSEDDTIKPVHVSKEMEPPKFQTKPRAFSWYGSKSNRAYDFGVYQNYSDGERGKSKSHSKMKERPKYDFNYSSESMDSDTEISYKGKKGKGKKPLGKPGRSHVKMELESSSEIIESAVIPSSSDREQFERHRPKRMKKSSSLPSFFFKRNKKKKMQDKWKKENRKSFSDNEDTVDNSQLSDSKTPSPTMKTEDPLPFHKRKTFKETPLVLVGSAEPPILKHVPRRDDKFKREYNNNVETVSSIFKRTSYKRVYRIPEVPMYKRKPAAEVSGHKQEQPSKPSRVTREAVPAKDFKMERTLQDSVLNALLKEQSLRGSENLTRDNIQPKLNESKTEITHHREFKSVDGLDKKNSRSSGRKGTKTEKATQLEKVPNQTQAVKGKQHHPVNNEPFDKLLQRDLECAQKTVNDINDQFGPTVFSRNYRSITSSMKETYDPKTKRVEPDSKSEGHTKSDVNRRPKAARKAKKDPEYMIKRKSYQEMLNKLEDELFDPAYWPDDSSDTDGDEIDLSFKKPHLNAAVNLEIKKGSNSVHRSLEKLGDIDCESEGDENVYHIEISSNEVTPQLPRPLKPTAIAQPPTPATSNVAITSVLNRVEEIEYADRIRRVLTKSDNGSFNKAPFQFDLAHEIRDNSETEANNAIDALLSDGMDKYLSEDSPPNFSPPPPPLSSELSTFNLVRPNMKNTKDVNASSAASIASSLFEKRERFKDEYYSKREDWLVEHAKPPPFNTTLHKPPTLKNTETENYETSVNALKPNLEISTGPSISYIPQNEKMKKGIDYTSNIYGFSTFSPVVKKRSNDAYHSSSLSPNLDMNYHEPIITSPLLLKAQIINNKKNNLVFDVKREYVGPYGISNLNNREKFDVTNQAESFYSPLHSDDFFEPLYSNQPIPVTGEEDTYQPPGRPPKPPLFKQNYKESDKSKPTEEKGTYFHNNPFKKNFASLDNFKLSESTSSAFPKSQQSTSFALEALPSLQTLICKETAVAIETPNYVRTQRPPLKSILRNSKQSTSSPSVAKEVKNVNNVPVLSEMAEDETDSTNSSASSRPETPPNLPDYSPPPPRTVMTEVQQKFLDTLLQRTVLDQSKSKSTNIANINYPPSKPSESGKEMMVLMQPRSRKPFLDFSILDIETESGLADPQPASVMLEPRKNTFTTFGSKETVAYPPVSGHPDNFDQNHKLTGNKKFDRSQDFDSNLTKSPKLTFTDVENIPWIDDDYLAWEQEPLYKNIHLKTDV